MSKNLKYLVLYFFIILATNGVLATLVETQVWEVSKTLRSNIIRFHVSWGVLCCIIVGIIIESHAKKVIKYQSAKYKIKKIFGVMSMCIFFVLVFTSFVIRQIKIPIIHDTTIIIHWVMGLFAIIVFTVHFLFRKKLDINKN